jgi:hypothetical protein
VITVGVVSARVDEEDGEGVKAGLVLTALTYWMMDLQVAGAVPIP